MKVNGSQLEPSPPVHKHSDSSMIRETVSPLAGLLDVALPKRANRWLVAETRREILWPFAILRNLQVCVLQHRDRVASQFSYLLLI